MKGYVFISLRRWVPGAELVLDFDGAECGFASPLEALTSINQELEKMMVVFSQPAAGVLGLKTTIFEKGTELPFPDSLES